MHFHIQHFGTSKDVLVRLAPRDDIESAVISDRAFSAMQGIDSQVDLRRVEFVGPQVDGIKREVSLMLVPDAEVGQHVLVHAGYGIGVVNEEEAAQTLELLREYADAMVEL